MNLDWVLLVFLGAGIAGMVVLGVVVSVLPQLGRARLDRKLGRVMKREGLLVLTYDDGPSGFTPLILEKLAAGGGKGTFFLLGEKVRREGGAERVERIVGEGHEVASHGEEHLHSWRVSSKRGAGNVRRSAESLGKWMGGGARAEGGGSARGGFFRPAYGRLSLAALWAARRCGMRVCWWTLDAGDTAEKLPERRAIVEEMLRQRGGIVLMHDYDRKDPKRLEFVLGVTEDLLRAAKGAGIRSCTVSELFAAMN